MRYYEAGSFDELYRAAVRDLYLDPEHECAPRGQLVRESLGVTLCLRDPRARLLSSPARAANYRFAVGEFLWYDRGARDLESISYYNARMAQWSDDSRTLNSAYGAVLMPQWRGLLAQLVADPDSRRAVATVYDPSYLTRETRDVPCTLSLHFLVRGGKLHLHVHMRSNDVIWGLANDLFSFTLMQEVVMMQLRRESAKFRDLELGEYIHTDGSLHLYEHHFRMAQGIAFERQPPAPPMEPIADLSDLALLQSHERALRASPRLQVPEELYSGAARWMIRQLNDHRRRKDALADVSSLGREE